MSFEEYLISELSNIEVINNKIYPLTGEEGITGPYVIYTSSEGKSDKTLNGYLESKEINLELDIVNTTYQNMKELTKNVLVILKGLINKSFDNRLIENITYEEPVELYETEVFLYRTTINSKIKIG